MLVFVHALNYFWTVIVSHSIFFAHSAQDLMHTCVVVEANTVPHGAGCVNVIMYEVQLRPLITLERETSTCS